MGYAFSQPIGSTPSLADAANAPQMPGSEILASVTAAAPGAYYITKDTSSFESMIFSFVYNGNPVVPALGDYIQIQILWYSSNFVFSAANLLWTDTFEVPSRFLPNFINSNRSIVHLPVRGKVCVISINNPASGGANPTLDYNVLGSATQLSRAIFTSDQAFFGVSDNILLDASSNVVVPVGGASPWVFGGLQSGPVTASLFVTVTANGGYIMQTGFGSSAVGLPELTISATLGAGNYRTFITGIYTARRPIRARVLSNAGGGNITAWALNVVRDEP